MITKINKFKKAGATVENFQDHFKATFPNGKICYFDANSYWFILGKDNVNQEQDYSFYYTAKSAIKNALR